MTPTAARPNGSKDSHWYSPEGEPCYSILGKTTGKPRPVDIRDARANGYLPGVSTILKVLHKEALVNWLIEQAVLACITTPRKKESIIHPTGRTIEVEEPLDVFIERVLHVERIQDQESQIARDRGTEIHDALEALFSNRPEPISEDIKPWVMPAYEAIKDRGSVITTEQILVGDGYAGRTDLILGRINPECYEIWDFKSAKKLPDPKKGGAWADHRLQLSAYAEAFLESQFAVQAKLTVPSIRTANLYISTVEQGKFVICEHPEWQETYQEGFVPLVYYWQWANKYRMIKKALARIPAAEPVAEAPIPLAEAEAFAAAVNEAKADQPAPAPRKHKVSLDIGVPTIPQPRFAPMAPPPMPNEP